MYTGSRKRGKNYNLFVSCFYFVSAYGRICGGWRCSPAYINAPPSYISQSLLFGQSYHRPTVEGVDEGSPLTLAFTFSSTFSISKWFFPIQEPSGRSFCVDKGRLQHSNYRLYTVSSSFLVGLSLNARRNGDGCLRAGRGCCCRS